MKPISHHVIAFDRPLSRVAMPAHQEKKYTELDLAEARRTGYREGTDSAREFADTQMVELRADAQALSDGVLSRLGSLEADIVAQLQQILPELAVEVGRRLLAGFEPPPEIIERICREALEQLYPQQDDLELVIGQRDAAIMAELLPAWRGQYPNLRVTIDEVLEPGDCLVRSRFGITDARRQAKLEGLQQELLPV